MFLRFTVPQANSDRSRPADLERLEVYGLTTDPATDPPRLPVEEWIESATLIATFTVAEPLPPGVPPEASGDEGGDDQSADPDVVEQGESVTWVERLSPDVVAPVVFFEDEDEDEDEEDDEELRQYALPYVAPPIPGPPRRTYLVRGVSTRGRESAPSERVAVSLAAPSPPPAPPLVSYSEFGVFVEWTPAPGARLPVQAAAEDGVLEATPVVRFPPPSTYLVYAVPSTVPVVRAMPQALNAPAAAAATGGGARGRARGGGAGGRAAAAAGAAGGATSAAGGAAGPAAELAAATPVETSWTQSSVTYGRERCFVVRTRTMVDGLAVLGAASPPTCIVPVDNFAPQAPTGLVAVAGDGVISLVWNAGSERDIAGYRVLRRTSAGATLEPLTEEPVEVTSYRDEDVTPGERYVYAVQGRGRCRPAQRQPRIDGGQRAGTLAARGEAPALHRDRRGARGSRRDEEANRAICDRGATPSRGMQRRSNAAGFHHGLLLGLARRRRPGEHHVMNRIYRLEHEGRVFHAVRTDQESGWRPVEGDLFGDYVTGAPQPFPGARILAPVTPSKVVAVGLNYRDHAKEMNKALPEEPLIFLKPSTAVVGPDETIVLPSVSERVDHEAELGIVIGTRAHAVPASQAADHVLGLTCVNDVTARDLQRRDVQYTRGKGFDTFAPVGPCIAVGLDPQALDVESFVNGERRQGSNTRELIFPIDRLIEFVSSVMTLLPGDVIATGTPSGVGPLAPGDRVVIKIEGIGELANDVAAG